jgi:hypothetical protein
MARGWVSSILLRFSAKWLEYRPLSPRETKDCSIARFFGAPKNGWPEGMGSELSQTFALASLPTVLLDSGTMHSLDSQTNKRLM